MATLIKLEDTNLDLASVYDRAAGGEEIVVARDGGPTLRLVVEPASPARTGKRQPGTLKGMIKEAPGVWDPMTDDELREIGLL